VISLAECRKILGDAARDLSDADLERLRQEAYGFAKITLSVALETMRKKNSHPAKEPRTPEAQAEPGPQTGSLGRSSPPGRFSSARQPAEPRPIISALLQVGQSSQSAARRPPWHLLACLSLPQLHTTS